MNIQQQDFHLHAGDVLIIVDVQNDFLPGGSLAVPHGDEVVPILNEYIGRFASKALPVFATRDWHPVDHCKLLGTELSLMADAIGEQPVRERQLRK